MDPKKAFKGKVLGSLVDCATLPKSQDAATKNNTVTIVPTSVLSLSLGNRIPNF